LWNKTSLIDISAKINILEKIPINYDGNEAIMNNVLKNSLPILVILILILGMNGCTSVPIKTVWRPFTNVMKSNHNIDPGARLHIMIKGETSPLLGSEDLRLDSLNSIITNLLGRRGFEIVDSAYDYNVFLYYKTERSSKMQMSSQSSAVNLGKINLAAASGSTSNEGLGVSLAVALSNIYAYSRYSKSFKIEDKSYFMHTLSVEFRDENDFLLWKGESYWESPDVKIFNIMASALQYIFCNLPTKDSIIPWVNEVKLNRTSNFFSLFCEGRLFICPALPASISFLPRKAHYPNNLPISINNPEALAAYIDLITTAEYAVPMGKFTSTNVTEDHLWEKVQLGHKYLIGPQKKPINILIDLVGESEGYRIIECWIATDEEYMEYQRRFLNWKIALNEYYDLYVN